MYGPRNGIPRYSLKINESCIYTRTNTWMFVVTLFIISLNWKQPKYPSNAEWILYANMNSNDYVGWFDLWHSGKGKL